MTQFGELAWSWAHLPPKQADAADLYFKQTVACTCGYRNSYPYKCCLNDAHFRVTNMAINFPNRSRSYDATRRAVRFWGYDQSMESSFFVTVDALRQIQPNIKTNAVDLVQAFDANRDRIYAIAARVYARGKRGTYDLNADDV
jgi:Protein of unknown function (DUF1488)